MQFLSPFNLTDSTYFHSYLGQNLSLGPFPLVVSYIYNIIRLFCHILNSVQGCLDSMNEIFDLHTLGFLCAAKVYGF